MTFIESLQVAMFCMAVVFFVLAVLWGLIRLISYVLNFLSVVLSSNSEKAASANDDSIAVSVPASEEGRLKLYNVDEPTAAMIMAIVSDESGIPLEELNFKSIKKIK